MSHEVTNNQALMDAILMRAADELGDITRPVMDAFYARHPEALTAFEHHGLGKRERLEAEMVETALFSVMTWIERPVEIEIMLYGSVPHHRNTLHVRPEWYRGLLDTMLDCLAATIPADAQDEGALLAKVRAGLQSAISEALATAAVVNSDA